MREGFRSATTTLGAAAVLVAALALAPLAQAAKSRFVLLSGPRIGDIVKTNGGPTVSDRLNRGRTRGVIVPQSHGNNFTFQGKLRGKRGQLGAEVLPEEALPPIFTLPSGAIDEEEVARQHLKDGDKRLFDEARNRLHQARRSLDDFMDEVSAAYDDGDIGGDDAGEIDRLVEKAQDLDKQAGEDIRQAQNNWGNKERRETLIRDAIHWIDKALEKKRIAMTLVPEDLIESDPPIQDPLADPLQLDPNPSLATAISRGDVAGEEDPGPDPQGFVYDGSIHLLGSPPSRALTFGPEGDVAGQQGTRPVNWDSSNSWAMQFLPTNSKSHVGAAFGGDARYEVGYRRSNTGKEKSRAWEFEKGSIHGFDVGQFAGGASFFTVNDSGFTAWGDHFLQGESGPFRAFRANLHTRGTTDLFRPRGGSSQPIASTESLLAEGGSLFPGGRRQATLWWGGKHYLRFGGVGQDTVVIGMNDAGTAVGVIGPPGSEHAALFEHGKAHDLNDLLPNGSNWVLTQASDVDNQGRVVGAGLLSGQQRAFELDLSP